MELCGDKLDSHLRIRFDNRDTHQDEWMPYDALVAKEDSGHPLALRMSSKDSLIGCSKLRGERGSFDNLLMRQVARALHRPTAHLLHAAVRCLPPAARHPPPPAAPLLARVPHAALYLLCI